MALEQAGLRPSESEPEVIQLELAAERPVEKAVRFQVRSAVAGRVLSNCDPEAGAEAQVHLAQREEAAPLGRAIREAGEAAYRQEAAGAYQLLPRLVREALDRRLPKAAEFRVHRSVVEVAFPLAHWHQDSVAL